MDLSLRLYPALLHLLPVLCRQSSIHLQRTDRVALLSLQPSGAVGVIADLRVWSCDRLLCPQVQIGKQGKGYS